MLKTNYFNAIDYSNTKLLRDKFIISNTSTMIIQEKYTQRLIDNNLRGDGREPFQSRQNNVMFLPRTGTLSPP